MKLSIVVPIYNVEEYLQQCITSIINQNLCDYEIIAIDDKSTDNSSDLLKKLENEFREIKAIYLNENIGLGPVRNLGIKKAKGKYIAFIDSDDFLHDEGINKLLTEIEDYDSDLIIGKAIIAKELNKNKIEYLPYQTFNYLNYDISNTSLRNCNSLINIPPCWSIIYKKDFLISRGVNFKRRYQEDHDFVIECLINSEKISLRCSTPYIYYRKRLISKQSSKSITDQEWTADRIMMMNDHFNAVIKHFDYYLLSYPSMKEVVDQRLVYYVRRYLRDIIPVLINSDENINKNNDLLQLISGIFDKLKLKSIDFPPEIRNQVSKIDKEIIALSIKLVINEKWRILNGFLRHKKLAYKDYDELRLDDYFIESLDQFITRSESPFLKNNIIPRLIPFTCEEVIIHIGTTKTGSTSIQNFLELNFNEFAAKKILYPKTGIYYDVRKNNIRTSGHHEIVKALWKKDYSVFKEFHDELETYSPRKVIISSENFFHQIRSKDQIKDLKSALGNTNVKILVYLRNQVEWSSSIYTEEICGSHKKQTEDFSDFIESPELNERLDYFSLIKPWSDVFGKENILIKSYDKLKKEKSLIKDFSRLIDIEYPNKYVFPDRGHSNNSSLSKEHLLLLKSFNSLDFYSKSLSYRPFVLDFIEMFSQKNSSNVKWHSIDSIKYIQKHFDNKKLKVFFGLDDDFFNIGFEGKENQSSGSKINHNDIRKAISLYKKHTEIENHNVDTIKTAKKENNSLSKTQTYAVSLFEFATLKLGLLSSREHNKLCKNPNSFFKDSKSKLALFYAKIWKII